MSEDFGLRLAALETRIALIEKALLHRLDMTAPWLVHPTPPMPQRQVTPPATGCICPVGAEVSCGNLHCPRRTVRNIPYGTASDTLTTTAIGAIPRNGSGVCKTCPPDWCGAGSESSCPERDDGRVT